MLQFRAKIKCRFNSSFQTHVQANLYGMGHDQRLFTRPESYEPERWLRNDSNRDAGLQAFIHLPWGHGPRMCIGKIV